MKSHYIIETIYQESQTRKDIKLKLRYVYDLAVEAFPIIAKTLPFSFFSWAVDSALLIMRGMIEDNRQIADIVNKKEDA